MATHPDSIVRFYASDMILNIHLNTSYLIVPKARSRAKGNFSIDSLPIDGKPISLNGAYTLFVPFLKVRLV